MLFKVGQKVILQKVNNAARGLFGDALCEEATVTSVARKYFTIDTFGPRYKFCMEVNFNGTYNQYIKDYCPDYVIYSSIEDFEDKKERKEILSRIRNFLNEVHFSNPNLCLKGIEDVSTDDLKKINQIISKDN